MHMMNKRWEKKKSESNELNIPEKNSSLWWISERTSRIIGKS